MSHNMKTPKIKTLWEGPAFQKWYKKSKFKSPTFYDCYIAGWIAGYKIALNKKKR